MGWQCPAAASADRSTTGAFLCTPVQCFDTLIPEADLYVLEQTTFDVLEPETCFCRAHWVSQRRQGTNIMQGEQQTACSLLTAPSPLKTTLPRQVDTPVQLAIERLIRRMLRQPHRPAVLLLNTYSFRLPSRGWYQRVSAEG